MRAAVAALHAREHHIVARLQREVNVRHDAFFLRQQGKQRIVDAVRVERREAEAFDRQRQQGLDIPCAHRLHRNADRGERGRHILPLRKPVDAHHGDIRRNAQFGLLQRGDRPCRQNIPRRDNRSELKPVLDHLSDALMGRLGRPILDVDNQGGIIDRAQSIAPPLKPAGDGATARTIEEQDPLMAQIHQIARRQRRRRPSPPPGGPSAKPADQSCPRPARSACRRRSRRRR